VMSAVFIPVTFIKGSSGVFYKQFGITLAVAIVISAVNALTLSPALSALFLKPHNKDPLPKKGLRQRFYDLFNVAFAAMTKRYQRLTNFITARKWIAVALIILFSGGLWLLMKTMPTGFVPAEDIGRMFVDVSLPPATSLEQTTKVVQQVDDILAKTPEIDARTMIVGRSLISGQGSSYGMVICSLLPFDQRKEKGKDLNSVIARLYGATSQIKAAKIVVFSPPMVPGFSFSSGFELKVEDKT
ncbi:MAG TPA: hydrophobe/amphiphile efflux-1 family RND transporter, partial [Prolixibacteraceae bacterium]|nr:hydrophobe/amphiphile efflux-1 family RND transporter [Prolixibacteraceae bacterium]